MLNRSLVIMLGSILGIVLLFALLRERDPVSERGSEPLFFFCAASNRAVMEGIREAYEKEFGRQVHIQYNASQTLLASIEVSGKGDLFLPADESFLEIAAGKGLTAEVLQIAKMTGVVAVKRGNPLGIHSFKDLLRDDVRLVQANPDAAAIGKVTRRVLKEAGLWKLLDEATTSYRTTVNDVANDIMVSADAGIVYDAVLTTYPDLEYIEIPELEATGSQVSLGVVESSKQPKAALHFARYVASKDRGLKHYSEHGFRVGKGDAWSDVPELKIFAGSMLRPVIEETITRFEEREGVRVSRVYNGCGILVANMKAGQTPDAYFACDTEFMNQVHDLFPESVSVSQNQLAILVPKGNPKEIYTLADLTREGLRVGIGHEKQCAMGWLTQNTLTESGMKTEVMKNVQTQTPSGDMLVNQLQTGSLDAAVAYLSNAAGAAEFLDAYSIEELPCSTATQPWAVAADSEYPQTASRLFQKICSAQSQEAFRAEGFQWTLGESAGNE